MAPLGSPGTILAQRYLAGTIVLGFLPFPFIVLRFWSRRLSKVKLAANDYIILAALVTYCGITANTIYAIICSGIGQHVTNLTAAEANSASKETLPPVLLWLSTDCLIRVSILHFYLDVFGPHKMTKMASLTLMAISICYWLAGFLAAIFFCTPIAGGFFQTIPAKCGNWDAFFLALSILSVFLNMAVVLLPQPCLWSLQMPIQKKRALAIVFGLGIIITLVSVARVISIHELNNNDITYSLVFCGVMNQLEPGLGITNACLPVLMPVIALGSQTRCLSFLNYLLPTTYIENSRRELKQTTSKTSSRRSFFWRVSSRSSQTKQNSTDGLTHINVIREVDVSSE